MLLVYKQLSSMIRWWVLFVVFKQNNIITYHYHTYISPLLWIYHTKPLKDESLALIKYIFIVVIQTSASLWNDLPCSVSMLKTDRLEQVRINRSYQNVCIPREWSPLWYFYAKTKLTHSWTFHTSIFTTTK